MTVTFQPDYRRLIKAINHEEPDRVPLADFQADTAMKDKFMGRPVRTIEDHVAFQAAAGFDFIYLRANYDYPGTTPVSSTGTMRSFQYSIAPDSETVGTYGAGPAADPGRSRQDRVARPGNGRCLGYAQGRPGVAARPRHHHGRRRHLHPHVDADGLRALLLDARGRHRFRGRGRGAGRADPVRRVAPADQAAGDRGASGMGTT